MDRCSANSLNALPLCIPEIRVTAKKEVSGEHLNSFGYKNELKAKLCAFLSAATNVSYENCGKINCSKQRNI